MRCKMLSGSEIAISELFRASSSLHVVYNLDAVLRVSAAMDSSTLQSCVGVALASLAFYVAHRFYNRLLQPLLPPGPKGLPIVGNIFDVPQSHQWLAYLDMSRTYGSDIISLQLMGTIVIVLNSATAVADLLEERSAIYSDRPRLVMLTELVGFGWNFGFMRYGPTWRRKYHRKILAQHFQPSQIHFFRPCELRAARVLLQRLLESPAKFERHLRHMAGDVILSTVYGIDERPENDPYLDIAEKALHAMAATANSGAWLVDTFPLLQYLPEWFPGAGFKRKAREWRKSVLALPEVPYNFVKQSMAAGTEKSSIMSRALEKSAGTPEADELEPTVKNILGVGYGGADTTVAVLGTFILAMTLYPEVQKKAQAAVDEVVGDGRLPDFNDKIPYVDAIVREVLRWRPITPLPMAHAVIEDDMYKGYRIPAGSVVLGNGWAILHDEAIYGPSTDHSIPERWLTKEGEINEAMREPGAAFGFGRRVCPGKDMAQWSVWICVASILASFDISKSLDNDGIPIEPSGEYTSGMISYPVPHKCDILPRSERAVVMIQTALQD
ncbi:cytochrome P450 [Mycena crocata]|nr:cytochrome P450 [Mycena crocata]